MNKLTIIEGELLPEIVELRDKLVEDTVENKKELERIKKLTMDRETNVYIKGIRSENNAKLDSSKKVIKSLKNRIVEIFLKDLNGPLEDYDKSLSELSKTADAISKDFVNDINNERKKFINNYIVEMIEGFEFKFDDVTEVVDTILGYLPSEIMRPLSTTENKTITAISTWFEKTVETCNNFDITFEEFFTFKFSETRYNAHLRDLVRQTQAKSEQIGTPQSGGNATPGVGSTTAKVILSEKLKKKKTARTTYEQAIHKGLSVVIKDCREAGLNDDEIINVIKSVL